MHPAALENIGCRFGVVPVSEHHIRTTYHDLAHRTPWHFVTFAVDNFQFDATDRTSGRVHFSAELMFAAVILRIQHGAAGRQFGHAITLKKPGRRKGVARPVQQYRGDWRSTIDDVPD
ncbi:hypothetical protein D3C76_1350520 [compost metagenome]